MNQSQPVRDGSDLELIDAVDQAILNFTEALSPERRRYPELIRRETLRRADYLTSFPHLTLGTSEVLDPEQPEEDLISDSNTTTTEFCLSPAVCLHVYREYVSSRLPENLVLTARGRCFRNESERKANQRQLEFSMREVVFLGSEHFVSEHLANGKQLVDQLADRFDVQGNWQDATDPFFLPRAENRAVIQKLKGLKKEFIEVQSSLPLASINRHGTYFGDRFDIETSGGETAYSACVAFGLDRWLHIHKKRNKAE